MNANHGLPPANPWAENGDLLRLWGKEDAKAKCDGNSGFLHCAAHDETVSSFGRMTICRAVENNRATTFVAQP
jgi:hypothetical protein